MQAVGDYTLGALLGKGGMSEVYAASHPALGNRLALKLLRDDADGAIHVEAAARKVQHPNVVRILDAGHDPASNRSFLVMERIDGELAALLARGRMSEDDARTLFAAVADGMAAVHAHGIVHRDLKPANVMLDDGDPRIVDFGIAKVLGENAALVTSRRIGTLGYMAPEQLVGGMIAPSVDVWALGVMLFEAVTGALPFGGFTANYTPQLVEIAPRVASQARVSPAYDALVARCLDGDPARRPSMEWIASALRGEVEVELVEERVTRDAGAFERVTRDAGSIDVADAIAARQSFDEDVPEDSDVGDDTRIDVGDLTRVDAPRAQPPRFGDDRDAPQVDFEAAPVSRPRLAPAPPPLARPRRWLLAGGLALVAVILVGVVATRSSDTERPATPDATNAPAANAPVNAPEANAPEANAPAVEPAAATGDTAVEPDELVEIEPVEIEPAARTRAKKPPRKKTPRKKTPRTDTVRRETLD